MKLEEFLNCMNQGEEVTAGSEQHQYTCQLYNEAMKIPKPNRHFNSEVRASLKNSIDKNQEVFNEKGSNIFSSV